MTGSSDHISGATGLTPTVTLSKNGGAFAAAAGAVTEVGNGWYSLAGNATDRNTLGELLLHASASGADPTECLTVIVPWDPFDSNLALQACRRRRPGPAAASRSSMRRAASRSRSGPAPASSSLTGSAVTVGTNNDKAGYALSSAEHTNVQADATAALGAAIPGSPTANSIFDRLDAKVSSRLAGSSVAAGLRRPHRSPPPSGPMRPPPTSRRPARPVPS